MEHAENIKGYVVEKQLGKGGMGEVFLVKDTLCQRWLALKNIREDMRQSATIRKRFLQEAKIAAKLTHPSIVPIYSIYEGEDTHFYTMPYIHGETLKEILKKTREEEKNGKISHPIGSSIPSLLRIFLNICEAIAYTHSQGILHRDLKPDNIIIGKYGETLILDWGLACLQEEVEEDHLGYDTTHEGGLTKPGKVPGTLSHIPPERVLGGKSTVKTDIYALGVILYQILTLKLPFHRTTIQALKKIAGKEKVYDPTEVSPNRDIPPFLSDIAKKCLSSDPHDRYENVEKLISDIKTYIEGKPSWMKVASCHPKNPEDWLFQELIPSAEYKAIQTNSASVEWIMLMIAKVRAEGNFCIESSLSFEDSSQGLGFILDSHSKAFTSILDKSLILWLSPNESKSCVLYQSHATVMQSASAKLQVNKTYKVKIEKIENHICVFIDDILILNYLSHIPMTGENFGFICKDYNFNVSEITLLSGAQRTMVSCLNLPDVFLSKGYFSLALEEYRKLAESFAGRSEGREALFRAGLTLLEQGNQGKTKKIKAQFYLQALEEFSKLRKTPGAPLEYLGKSLVYQAWDDLDEEVKCLELALRKYPAHPLNYLICDQIFFRLHQSASKNKHETLVFALIAIRLLPLMFAKKDNESLLSIIEKQLSPLLSLVPHNFAVKEEEKDLLIILQLALVLDKPFILMEIIEKSTELKSIENALFCLLLLKHNTILQEMLPLYEAQGGKSLYFTKIVKASTSSKELKNFLKSELFLSSPLKEVSLVYLFEKALLSFPYDVERLEQLLFCKDLNKPIPNNPYLFFLILSCSLVIRNNNFFQKHTEIFTSLEKSNPYLYLAYLTIIQGKERALKEKDRLKSLSIQDTSLMFLQLFDPLSKAQMQNLLEKRTLGNEIIISLKILSELFEESSFKRFLKLCLKQKP